MSKNLPQDAPPLVRLSTWLSRLDGWATFYESDAYADDKRGREPMTGRERAQALYLLKERAIKAMHESGSPAVQLGILEAPARDVSKNSDYYSLYILIVEYGPLGRWQFHTPVPIGERYLPRPRTAACPILGQRPTEQGRFQRLGRPLGAEDRRAYPEPEVVYQVWRGIKDVIGQAA